MNFAHLHPMMIHLPIGIWIASAILFFADKRNWYSTQNSTYIVLIASGIFFAVLSVLTGILQLIQSEVVPMDILFHISGAVFSFIVAVLLLRAHLKAQSSKIRTILYLLLVAVITLTGHFGASITHGEAYLFQFPENTIQSKHVSNTHYINIMGMKFKPQLLKIAKGDSVIFVNKDLVPHDVVNDVMDEHLSPKISASQKWGTKFYENIDFHCSFHPSMTGKIIIE